MRRLILFSVLGLVLSSAAYIYASDSTTALLNTPISITGPDGVCKRVTNASGTGLSAYIPTTSVAEWQSFVAHPPSGVTLASCATDITVPCTTNVNLYTLAGSPASAGTYNFTIPTGCVVGSNSTAQPALTTGSFPIGSTVTLVNNGYIEGMGGRGGDGGFGGNPYYGVHATGYDGEIGGVAMAIQYPISIQNAGFIFGGGGGGGAEEGTGVEGRLGAEEVAVDKGILQAMEEHLDIAPHPATDRPDPPGRNLVSVAAAVDRGVPEERVVLVVPVAHGVVSGDKEESRRLKDMLVVPAVRQATPSPSTATPSPGSAAMMRRM